MLRWCSCTGSGCYAQTAMPTHPPAQPCTLSPTTPTAHLPLKDWHHQGWLLQPGLQPPPVLFPLRCPNQVEEGGELLPPGLQQPAMGINAGKEAGALQRG